MFDGPIPSVAWKVALAIPQRGISSGWSGDVIAIAFPPVFVHVFNAEGMAIGAVPDWHADHIA